MSKIKQNLVTVLQEDYEEGKFTAPKQDYYKVVRTYDDQKASKDDFAEPNQYDQVFTVKQFKTPRAPDGEKLRVFTPESKSTQWVLTLLEVVSDTYDQLGMRTWALTPA